jgi:hypothetical protein
MRPSPLLLLILAGMVVQSALGLAFNPYRDIDWIALGWLGNDGVTLFLVCPVLAAALSGSRFGAPRWQLTRLGLLGYAVYNYAFYMLGASLNTMFPLYVALFAAAVIALVSELSAARVVHLAGSYSPRTPVRILGGYLAAVAICLSAVWIGMWALHVFAGRPAPGSPEVFRLVAALDLGIMVPALSIGGVLLWLRKPMGYVLASIAGIQAALYLFVLSVNSALGIHRGLTKWPGELPIWAPLCASTAACALVLLRFVSSERSAANAA